MAINTPQTLETPLFNVESQKQLAKLMAQENISIRVGNYETAFFDCRSRVLGLPFWNFNNKHVSDLLVGHEIGHALETPIDGIDRFKERFPGKPFAICNIIEDIREERLTVQRYPGFAYTLRKGYEAMMEMDIFNLMGKDLTTLGFADRLNIRSKTRRTDLVELNEAEEAFYQDCLKAESFDDVLDLCEKAFDHVEDHRKNENENEQPQPPGVQGEEGDKDQPNDDSMSMSDPGLEDQEQPEADDAGEADNNEIDDEETESEGKASSTSEDQNESKEEDEEDEDPLKNVKESFGSGGKACDESYDDHDLTSSTMDAFNEGLAANTANEGIKIIETPSHNELMDRVIDLPTLREARKEYLDRYNDAMTDPNVQAAWNDFKKTTKKHVSILSKEFERRKAAYQYSRATEARTGKLDVNRLHSYKYDDQLFKSITQLADAKSHGMIFLIDYSGSMEGQLQSVVAQTLQLVFFCRAVNIPFEVYSFTTPQSWHGQWGDDLDAKARAYNHFGESLDLDSTQVVQLLHSNLKKNEFEEATKELWYQNAPKIENGPDGLRTWRGTNSLRCKFEERGGTPLNQSLLILNTITKNFQKKHNIQKTNLIILTDGEGSFLSFMETQASCALNKKKKEFNPVCRRREDKYMMVNKKLIPIQGERGYRALIKRLGSLKNTKVVGFFMTYRNNEAKHEVRRAILNIDKKNISRMSLFNKINKASRGLNFYEIINAFNYDSYYVMKDVSSLNIVDENLLNDIDAVDASKSKDRNQLTKAFKKMTGDKKTTRVFLNKFAELIS